MVKIKHKDFIGAVPIIPCLNSSWIMGLRIHGEWRTQTPLSSPATIDPLPKFQDRQGLYRYKKMVKMPRLITKQYPLLIIIMLFLLTDSPQKLKSEKIHETLRILFYVSLQRLFFFY